MNLFPLQDWSSLNKLAGDVGFFLGIAIFVLGGVSRKELHCFVGDIHCRGA